MPKKLFIVAMCVDSELFGYEPDQHDIARYLTSLQDDGIGPAIVWSSVADMIEDHQKEGPITTEYVAGQPEAKGTPCPDCGGAGAFAKTGMDCGRCYGGGTITPESEAARTIEDRYVSAAIAAGWHEQGDGTWAHDGEGDGEPGLVASARAACELDNITVEQ